LPTCAEIFAQTLRDAGITRMFGLPGGEILDFMDAARRAGIEAPPAARIDLEAVERGGELPTPARDERTHIVTTQIDRNIGGHHGRRACRDRPRDTHVPRLHRFFGRRAAHPA